MRSASNRAHKIRDKLYVIVARHTTTFPSWFLGVRSIPPYYLNAILVACVAMRGACNARACVMERFKLVRRRLVSRRDVLLLHYRDAVEKADAELDSREIEDGMVAVERWAAQIATFLSDEAGELRAIIAAIARIDSGTFGACRVCGGVIDETVIAASPSAVCCADCAVTREMPALLTSGVAPASDDQHAAE